MDPYGLTASFLNNHPELGPKLEKIIRYDEKGPWTYQDVTISATDFGKLAESDLVEKFDGGYRLVDRQASRAAVTGDKDPSKQTNEKSMKIRDTDLSKIVSGNKVDDVAVYLFQERIILLSLIVIIGGLFRSYNLGGYPFWIDEVTSVVVAMNWLDTGRLVLPSGNSYLRSPLSTYLFGASIWIFGESEVAARLPSVLSGVLIIPLTYILSKEAWSSTKIGLVAALLTSVSGFSIAWSRQARMYALFQFFFLFTIVSYFYLSRRKEPKFLAPLVIGFVGSALTHMAWIFLIPIISLDAVISFSTERQWISRLNHAIVVTVGILIAVVVVFRHPIFPSWVYGLIFKPIDDIVFDASPIWFLVKKLPGIFLFAIVGTASVRDKVTSGGRGIILSTIAFWIPLFTFIYFGIAIIGKFWPRYLYFAIPFLFILAAGGIVVVGERSEEFIREKSGSSDSVISVTMVLLVILVATSPNFALALGNLSEISEPQPNYRAAANYSVDSVTLQERVEEDHTVITNRQLLVKYYFETTPDYMAYSGFAERRNGRKMDFYTDSEIVSNSRRIRDIVTESSCGWVIYNSYLELAGEEWIRDNLSHVVTIDFPSDDLDAAVHVYHWNDGGC